MNAHTPILTPYALENAEILRVIQSGQHKTKTALGLALDPPRDQSNVTKTLKRLEGEGWVDESGLALTSAGDTAVAAIRQLELGEPPAGGAASIDGHAQLMWIQVMPDPLNPRKHFDAEAIEELANSIAKDGLLENLVVRPGAKEEWLSIPVHRLVAGERRYRAIGRLIERGEWPKDRPIMCRVVDIDDEAHRRIALVENLQRKDLRPVDEALALQELIRVTRKSTAEIAQEIGFTQRFVQQRLQLLQLSPSQREDLNAGRMSIEDARRIAAQPAPKKLEPAELLVVAECLVKIATDPMKGSYNSESEVSYLAKDDPVFEAVRKVGVINFEEQHWQSKKAIIRRGYQGREVIDRQLSDLFGDDGDKADALLDDLRTKVAGAEAAAACAADDKYLTSWLNGPFELSEKAKAAIAADKAGKAAEREANKKRKEQREKRLVSFRALDARLQAESRGPVDPEVPRMLAKLDITLPVQLKNGRIVDAKDKALADANWRFAEDGETVNLLLATLINAAGGYDLGAQADIED